MTFFIVGIIALASLSIECMQKDSQKKDSKIILTWLSTESKCFKEKSFRKKGFSKYNHIIEKDNLSENKSHNDEIFLEYKEKEVNSYHDTNGWHYKQSMTLAEKKRNIEFSTEPYFPFAVPYHEKSLPNEVVRSKLYNFIDAIDKNKAIQPHVSFLNQELIRSGYSPKLKGHILKNLLKKEDNSLTNDN